MTYSCKQSFRKLTNTIANHDEVLEGEELEQYKLLGGWTTDEDWDTELVTRYENMNKRALVRGLPQDIRENLQEIRERQIEILKKEEEMKRRALEE